jgi:vacuolar-type H+-ATPase subunit E/Vma4
LEELKKRAKTESTRAVKIAQEKTVEILNEVEKQTGAARKKAGTKIANYKRKIVRAKKTLGLKAKATKKSILHKKAKSKK